MRPSPHGTSSTRVLSSVVACILSIALMPVPRAAAADVRTELQQIARRIADAQSALGQTNQRMHDLNKDAERAHTSLRRARIALDQIARTMYMTGGMSIGPIPSDDAQAMTDRAFYAGFFAAYDRNVIQTVVVHEKRLARARQELGALRAKQLSALAQLKNEQRRLDVIFAAEKARLAAIAASQRASRSSSVAVVSGRGPFMVCPVDQPRAYTNDFGDPRGGGRSHQGIDILAPRNTAIRAPFAGRVASKSVALGGLSVKVYGSGGYVFNAHLQSTAGRSGFVQAGTVIGYVGNSGNASGGPTHDHFEWHPGGGSAVNPYGFLNQVC